MGSAVAQLVERSPQNPEIRGLNPGIDKLLSNICLLSTMLKKRKKRKKEAGNGPFFKKTFRNIIGNHLLKNDPFPVSFCLFVRAYFTESKVADSIRIRTRFVRVEG